MRETTLSETTRTLWAKTGDEGKTPNWMPLYVHLGDTACLARHMWRWLPRKLHDYVCEKTGLSPEQAESLVSMLAGTHDIGKATPNFQAKVARLREIVRATTLGFEPMRKSFSHAYMGELVLEDLLTKRGWDKRTADSWAGIVGAHHGSNPNACDLRDIRGEARACPNAATGDNRWKATQTELVEWVLANTLGDEREGDFCDLIIPKDVQIVLTAIVIRTDWVASNTDRCPLTESVENWEDCVRRAQLAWDGLKIPDHYEFPHQDKYDDDLFHERFPQINRDEPMRDVQRTVITVAQAMEKPGLMIIEANMGEGKTEPALVATEILSEKFGCGGMCYLLPTMATSDAMFSRVRNWLKSMVAHDEHASTQDLHLLHSKASLNEEFASMQTWNSSWMGDDDKDDDAVIAHQWFSGRKRGILAPFVVGTIDQSLMAALNTRHVHLRHLGLATKVAIMDEVHAYDAYTNTYLDRELSFLGAYEVPTILLSATLPPSRRAQLIQAYWGQDKGNEARRRPVPTPPDDERGMPAYPIVTTTYADPKSPVWYHTCKPSSRRNEIELRFISDDIEKIAHIIEDSTREGGCVCMIFNTVKKAQRVYKRLRALLKTHTVLMHSRFLATDRAMKERDLVRMLGRDDTKRPRKMVVISTQVMEQSLDVDFDLLLTDIAPIDILFQRIGRLHRHQGRRRPKPLEQAVCYVMGSSWSNDPPTFDKGTKAVYEEALLLKTVHVLRNVLHDVVTTPDDVAFAVRAVYDERLDVPESWAKALDEAEERMRRHIEDRKRAANTYLLKRPSSRRRSTNLDGWMSDMTRSDETRGMAKVRDTQDSLSVMLVTKTDRGYEIPHWVADRANVNPCLGSGAEAPDDGSARVAASCTVCLPREMTATSRMIDELTETLENADDFSGWQKSRWLHGLVPLVVDESGEATVECSGRTFELRYSYEIGLELIDGENDD